MKTKTFDSVKLMRKLREELSREMSAMTSEEKIRFIQEKASAMRIPASRNRAGEPSPD
ncbi:MAG: hypothetical protein KJ060_07565 [Candidatus Hydrogenedentes bacterium]|nr:hypothetical protein [Candidatus Hydrogenedentota bacterium]